MIQIGGPELKKFVYSGGHRSSMGLEAYNWHVSAAFFVIALLTQGLRGNTFYF